MSGAAAIVRGTIAATVPMEEPTIKRVNGMMATSNFVLRVAEDLEHVAFFDNDAFIHHDDAIADLFHYVHFVRDHDDRQTELLVNLLEELKRCLSGFRVKSRSGLVGKKNLRIGRKRTSNTDALFLTAGELRRILVDVFA